MSIIGAPDDIGSIVMRRALADLRSGIRHPDAADLVAGFTQSVSDDAENLVESLKTSDAKALFVMAQCWKVSPTELIPGHVLLKTFLHQLDGSKVPKSNLPALQNDPSERAWASLIGIGEKFVAQFAANPDFRTRIISAWPGIFKWCKYLYTQRVSPENDFDTARKNIEVFCDMIAEFVHDKQLCNILYKTKGMVKLCTQLWMHRAAPPPMSALIMYRLLVASTWDDLDEVCAAADEKPDLIAQIAVKRLRTAMDECPMHPAHVSMHTMALFSISRLAFHALTESTLNEQATSAVTKMLELVAQSLRGKKGTPDKDHMECINGGFTFLRFAFIRDQSYRWVAEAVDAGLLRVICELAPLIQANLHQFGRDCVQHILRESLPKHLVYLSVVKAVDRGLNEVEEAAVEKGIAQSWLREDWVSLEHVSALRSAVAKLPKSVRGRPSSACESLSCGKRGTKKDLQRCTGCLTVYYCSKKCQKEAWPNHRAICKLKGALRASEATEERRRAFAPSDVQFFRELFFNDAPRHLRHLHRLAKRKYPAETQGEHFVFCLDYTDPRYPAGTCALKDIRTYEFPPLTGEELDPENVVKQNEELIDMVRRDPKGHTFIEATFAWGEQNMTRNFIMRPNIWDSEATGTEEVTWDGRKTCEHGEAGANAHVAGVLEGLLGLNLDLD